jgi:hypothetical protein
MAYCYGVNMSICSTLSGNIVVRHPEFNILVRGDGMIKNAGNWIAGGKTEYGYRRVVLMVNGKPCRKMVHRLVAECFIPNPNRYQTVDHINMVRDDNRVENLRWATMRMQNHDNHGKVVNRVDYGVRACEDRNAYYRAYRAAHPEKYRVYEHTHYMNRKTRGKV